MELFSYFLASRKLLNFAVRNRMTLTLQVYRYRSILFYYYVFMYLFQWPAFFADVIISLIMAAILSLCIEAPARNLEKCLLKTGELHQQISY